MDNKRTLFAISSSVASSKQYLHDCGSFAHKSCVKNSFKEIEEVLYYGDVINKSVVEPSPGHSISKGSWFPIATFVNLSFYLI